MQTETVELDSDELELELEDDVESSPASSSKLSNEFFIEGDSDVVVEAGQVYYSDDEPEVLVDDNDRMIVVPSPSKSKNRESALDLLSKEEYIQYVNVSRDVTIKKVALGLQEIKTKINFNDNVHFSNQLETLIRESDKSGGGVKDIILHEIYKNKNVDPRELFDKINPNSNNEAEFYVFKEQFDKVKGVLSNEQYKASYVAKMNNQATELLLVKMLDFSLISKIFSYNDEYKLLKKFYSTDGMVTHFKCEHCSNEEHEHKSKINKFIYVMNISGKDFSLVLPLMCDSCGKLSVFDPKYLQKLMKDCAHVSANLKTTKTGSNKFTYYRSVMDIGVYNPSYKDLTDMLSKFNVVPIDGDEELEMDLDEDESPSPVNHLIECSDIEDDWLNIVNRFVDNVKIIGDSKFKLYSSKGERLAVGNDYLASVDVVNANDYTTNIESMEDVVNRNENSNAELTNPSSTSSIKVGRKRYEFDDRHLKNVTKIFSTMHGNYPYLKSIAVTSAINLLKPLGLNKFSLSSKSFYKVYSTIDNLNELDKKDLEFISNELGYKIYNEDGSLDESISVNLFNYIEDMHVNFEDNKRRFLNSMYDNLYYLSYMTLSSSDHLSEEDVNDYMYDDDIKTFIDRVSDFMIMTYISEDWLNKYNPAIAPSTSSMQVSYRRNVLTAVKSMKSVNRKKTIREYIDKICVGAFGEIHTLMSLVDSNDSINYIQQFLEACYNRDLYEMYRCSNRILGNFKSFEIPEFMDLVQLITLFPKKKLDVDKFSFYFPNLECDNKYKARFVRLFERKGFVPKVLEGNNEEEKLLYYENLDYNTDKVDYMPDEIKKLLTAYDGIIRFGRFISYSSLFKDYAVFYSARDILFSVLINKLSMNRVLDVLNLDSTLASMLIEDSYEMPKADPIVVEYIDLLNLPLDRSLNLEGVTQKDKINELLDRYDEIRPMFRNFPKLYDLVSSLLKDVEE